MRSAIGSSTLPSRSKVPPPLESKLSANTRKYVEQRGEKDAKSAVFYLGSVSMTIGGVDYVSWKDWGKYAALA